MSLAGFSIKRPVTITMFFCGVILLGLVSWFNMPQELFPQISYPQITIATVYENASPKEIETMITQVIEESLGTMSGIKSINSISKEGLSLVFVKFYWNVDMDFAALNAREKIDLAAGRLPEDSGEPLVLKFNPFEMPVYVLSVNSHLGHEQLDGVVRNIIKPGLERVEGVASVSISGGVEKEVLVDVSPSRLAANELSLLDVINSIEKTNLNYPAGMIKDEKMEYLVRTIGRLNTIDDIKNVIVGENKEDLSRVNLKEIADVDFKLKDKTSYSRYDAKANISLSIQRQSDTNIIKLAKKIKKKLKKY